MKERQTYCQVESGGDFGKDRLVIDPMGGLIRKLVLGDLDVFWRGTRPDGNEAATHVSIPWHGPFEAELPAGVDNPGFHGPGRKTEWEVIHNSSVSSQQTLRIPGLEQLYPNLLAWHTVAVAQNKYWDVLTFRNNGTEVQKHVNPGLHWYLKTHGVPLNEIMINDQHYEPERWYTPTILDARRSNTIVFPGIAKYEFVTNMPKLILFSQHNERGDDEFAAIEPAHDPSEIAGAPQIKPGEYVHYHGGIILREKYS